jgi:hypothetical protein
MLTQGDLNTMVGFAETLKKTKNELAREAGKTIIHLVNEIDRLREDPRIQDRLEVPDD